MHVLAARLDVQQPGEPLAGLHALVDLDEGAVAIGRVVVGLDLAQRKVTAVVQLHLHGVALFVAGADFLGRRHEISVHGRVVELAAEGVALGRILVVVEGHAGRQHVDQGKALVRQARLDQRHQLGLVAGKAARHEGRTRGKRRQHRVDRRLHVDLALLGLAAEVGRGGELALGQPVHAVVLDDVEHAHVAPHGVAELAQPDGQRIAVARHAEIVQVAVGRRGAGGDRRHAAVHGVDAVRLADEIRRCLGRAADAGEFHHAVRRQRQLPAGLHDGGSDRVVAAAGAQRGQRALVVTAAQPQRVAGQAGMVDLRLGDVGHAAAPFSSRARTISTSGPAAIGRPS